MTGFKVPTQRGSVHLHALAYNCQTGDCLLGVKFRDHPLQNGPTGCRVCEAGDGSDASVLAGGAVINEEAVENQDQGVHGGLPLCG